MTIKEKIKKWMDYPEVKTLAQHRELNNFQSDLITLLLHERKELEESLVPKRFKGDNIIN